MAAFKTEPKDGERKGLARRVSGPLSKPAQIMTVGMLEQALLKKYPAADAEEWDRTGITVGDPAAAVRGVALALDATVPAIKTARDAGANVLLTHHPAFLAAPDTFRPGASAAEANGAVVWAAVESGVALMNFHTALDVSADAARALPSMLGLTLKGVVDPIGTARRKGYGQLCAVQASDAPLTLGRLAARCVSVFGRQPRVWGDFSRELKTVATCTGSAGDLLAKCRAAGVECLVAGEVKYHAALEFSQAGLAIIEVGHDVSELPLVAVLAAAVRGAGIAEDMITVIDQGSNWTTPEAIRV